MAIHNTLLGLPPALTITICGGGNGAHVTAAFLGSKPGLAVNVLTRQPAKWSHDLTLKTVGTSWAGKGDILGHLQRVTDNAADVIPTSDIVLIAAPAHVHPILLKAVAPYLRKGVILGGIYCQGKTPHQGSASLTGGLGGFDWAVREAVKDLSILDGFFGLQNIPWVCKATEYGKTATLIGPKKKLLLASSPVERAPHYACICSLLFDIPTVTVPNFLALTLSPSNQIIHPAR